MDLIAALASNPIPTSIACVIAIACLAGYYFHVLPLMDDHKKLKNEKAALDEALRNGGTASVGEVLHHMAAFERILSAVQETLQNNVKAYEAKYAQLASTVAEIQKHHITADKSDENLHVEVENLRNNIARLSELTHSFVAGSQARDESIDRLLQEVNRNMQNINEKHSQIIGALLGMSRLQDRNRGI